MKGYNFKMEDAELELLRKDAYRHKMTISDYLRTLVKNQREADFSAGNITSRDLADLVLDDNSPFDKDWLRQVKRTKGVDGLLEIARTTTRGYAPDDCSEQTIELASQLVLEAINFEI